MKIREGQAATPSAALADNMPSKAKILKATAVALFGAAVIFFSAVLPAAYGIDPLHTGAALGLVSSSKGGSPAPVPAESAAPTESPAPVITGVFSNQPNGYKIDSRVLRLRGGEGIEIKYHLQKGAAMVYSWAATGKVQYEFHGEPDVKPPGAPADYFESYEKDMKDGKDQLHGTFMSPTTGIQGWFWDNTGDDAVTIKLVTAGFYDYVLQNKNDVKTRLQPADPQ